MRMRKARRRLAMVGELALVVMGVATMMVSRLGLPKCWTTISATPETAAGSRPPEEETAK